MFCAICGCDKITVEYRKNDEGTECVRAKATCTECGSTWTLEYELVKEKDLWDATAQKERNLADPSYRADLMSMQGPDGDTI